ncbi:MAG: histidine phosphatase family protein [Betaproteobacteria bacterium]|nr:histidine phosphatase family protein [Betaproteobacteria bacterium]
MTHCNIGAALAVAAILFAVPRAAPAETRSSSPDPAHALEGAALVKALRAGGFTLYFRHTATDFAQNDAAMKGYDECALQRNLSEEGRRQARAVGEWVRRLSLPVGEVIASPFCRTMETGRLMFGRAEPSTVVRGYEGTSSANADYTKLVALLASPPAKVGTLRMITTHGNPFRAIAGPPHLQEGEAAVLKPLGQSFAVVARIKVGDWEGLAAADSK